MAPGLLSAADIGAGKGTRVTIVICAAIRLYRDGLERVLFGDPRVEVVGTAETLREAVSTLRRRSADVLLVDLEERETRDTLPTVRAEAPETRVLAIGVPSTVDDVLARAEAGIDGFLTREASLDELVAGIIATHRGEVVCSPQLAGALLRRVGALSSARLSDLKTLTARQREVLELIRQGLSNKQIAAALAVELPTVKNHVHAILEKLEVSSRHDVVRAARRY